MTVEWKRFLKEGTRLERKPVLFGVTPDCDSESLCLYYVLESKTGLRFYCRSIEIFSKWVNSVCRSSARVSEQSAGVSRPAARRDQPRGDGGSERRQAAGDPQGHRYVFQRDLA